MKPYMDIHFLLSTQTSQTLYKQFARECPIIDYHSHFHPREIADDVQFDNLTKLWLGADENRWRLMRAGGIEEELITGDTSDKDKFLAYASVVGKSLGNPIAHWTNMELARYFDYHKPLSSATADEVWEMTTEKLMDTAFSTRRIIEISNVSLICTSDDPASDLKWHAAIAADSFFKTSVLPTFCPDSILNIEMNRFADYISRLSTVSGKAIASLSDMLDVLKTRMDFFQANGCKLSDHNIEKFIYAPSSIENIDDIFQKRMAGGDMELTEKEINEYKTFMMLFCASEYAKRKWTMQLHLGRHRDTNTKMKENLGTKSGFDSIAQGSSIDALRAFLDMLANTDLLPKMILSTANPNEYNAINALVACFQDSPSVMMVSQGAPWGYNECYDSMKNYLAGIAAHSYFPGYIGMTTDSRSFLSFAKHEYFRRILCDMIGSQIENGLYPLDIIGAGEIITNICYNNAAKMIE
ncbi:MAG TPA: glucuronate isomerase [Bacillota bacterium]|nr:glucuronate isomerase [Bacillota bacterium]